MAVGGSRRDFVDADRRCEERARAAAVFAALILEPPSIADAPLPSTDSACALAVVGISACSNPIDLGANEVVVARVAVAKSRSRTS